MKTLVEKIYESRNLGKGWAEEKKDGFVAQILAFDESSKEYGIDGGKISKLFIKDSHNKIVCNYDRGWDIEPTRDVQKFYDEIIKKYN